nr:hypothetical protein [Tanacetum cinerariifolium]GFB51196.1 hypothetical protein [Tanacetum cinerariifolium]
MPYTIARAICMHDYDMLPPSHGGYYIYFMLAIIYWGVWLHPSLHVYYRVIGWLLRTTILLPLCHVYLFIFYVIPFFYIRSLSVMLNSIPFHVLYGRAEGFRPIGSKDLTCEDWMVKTCTDAELVAAVQNALQTLLPQIHAKIREEFRTGSGPSGSGGNPPPITIHTWLERFNKQKPRSFEKAIAPTRLAVYKFDGDALAWWKAYKQAKGGDERLKREYHSIRQTDTETSTEFMQRFL